MRERKENARELKVFLFLVFSEKGKNVFPPIFLFVRACDKSFTYIPLTIYN